MPAQASTTHVTSPHCNDRVPQRALMRWSTCHRQSAKPEKQVPAADAKTYTLQTFRAFEAATIKISGAGPGYACRHPTHAALPCCMTACINTRQAIKTCCCWLDAVSQVLAHLAWPKKTCELNFEQPTVMQALATEPTHGWAKDCPLAKDPKTNGPWDSANTPRKRFCALIAPGH